MTAPHHQQNLLLLVNQFLDYLLVERQASPLTLRNYRQWLYRFVSWLQQARGPHPQITAIDQQSVRDYRLWLAKFQDRHERPLKPSTQSYHVIALRSFLRWLVKNDYPVLSPEKIDLPKAKGRRLEFLNHEQLQRLLSQPAISTPMGLRDKAILELLFSTGLRVSELVALNRDQLDLKRREFGVQGKGSRVRVVFLSPRAAHWLERYLVTRQDHWPPLFVRLGKTSPRPPKGQNQVQAMSEFDREHGETRRLTARSIQRIVRKYAQKARLPVHITPHGLRHTFATDLLRAGADLRSVQELLGHKNIATTQIYTHITNRQLRQVHQEYHDKGE